jgi:hypothetical protein
VWKHIAVANMSNNRAMDTHKILYILALDILEPFGSVSHVQFGNNQSILGFH